MKIRTFQKWKAAFIGYASVYNKPFEVPITNCQELNITLQYPITKAGWDEAQRLLRMNNPHLPILMLLALTPINTDETDEVEVTIK